jgi:hypothetical protein
MCRFRRRLRVVPMVGLVLLTAAAWGVTAHVCGWQALLIPPEAGAQLMLQLLPGTW